MNRASFLARVRQAAKSGQKYRVRTEEIPEGVGYVGAGADLPEAFAREINNVGGTAHIVSGTETAREKLAEILDELRPKTALCWEHPLLERIGLAELLSSRGVTLCSHATLAAQHLADQRKSVFAADIGISSVDWGVAETGTLILRSQPGRERMVSLVPPVHVAVVEVSQIVPDLFDVFAALQAEGLDNLHSNIALITGPSKTGDIELQLTTGVHGPGTWIVIISTG